MAGLGPTGRLALLRPNVARRTPDPPARWRLATDSSAWRVQCQPCPAHSDGFIESCPFRREVGRDSLEIRLSVAHCRAKTSIGPHLGVKRPGFSSEFPEGESDHAQEVHTRVRQTRRADGLRPPRAAREPRPSGSWPRRWAATPRPCAPDATKPLQQARPRPKQPRTRD